MGTCGTRVGSREWVNCKRLGLAGELCLDLLCGVLIPSIRNEVLSASVHATIDSPTPVRTYVVARSSLVPH